MNLYVDGLGNQWVYNDSSAVYTYATTAGNSVSYATYPTITYPVYQSIYQYPSISSISTEWDISQLQNAQYQSGGQNGYWNSLAGAYGQGLGSLGASGLSGGIYYPPETHEQQAARLKAKAEREAKRKAASMRAEHLLFSILTPIQVKQYTDHDYFEVVIDKRTYRIKKGIAQNIELIEAGKPVARYCAHPENAYEMPSPDAMISQLLMLKSNEAEFLKIANRTVLQ